MAEKSGSELLVWTVRIQVLFSVVGALFLALFGLS